MNEQHNNFDSAVNAAAYQNYVVDRMNGFITESFDNVQDAYMIEAMHRMINGGVNNDNTEFGFPLIEWVH